MLPKQHGKRHHLLFSVVRNVCVTGHEGRGLQAKLAFHCSATLHTHKRIYRVRACAVQVRHKNPINDGLFPSLYLRAAMATLSHHVKRIFSSKQIYKIIFSYKYLNLKYDRARMYFISISSCRNTATAHRKASGSDDRPACDARTCSLTFASGVSLVT